MVWTRPSDDIESDAITPTEQSPLLKADIKSCKSTDSLPSSIASIEDGEISPAYPTSSVVAVLLLLFLGVFIANAEGTLVIASVGTISSEFSSLENASWLTTAYTLGTCAMQPLVGKLSDIFGRKQVLLVSYVIFTIGAILCGMGQSMGQLIFGRVIGGLGGAGMTVIVSILITDLVPKIEVASWRSYINVVSTSGRSLGGPMGGFLTDSVGWRWSFLGQAPLMLIAIALVSYGLQNPTRKSDGTPIVKAKARSKLGRIDFIGSLLLIITIVTFILSLDLPGRGLGWASPLVHALALISLVLGASFIVYESKYAQEPIFPPTLLAQRNIWTGYAIHMLQGAAQLAMMFSVPLYFQITQGSSNTRAGGQLVPAVVGNAIGALTAGVWIRRTGRYKYLTTLATLCGMTCYTLLITRWHGDTGFWESLDIVPGGFGSGIAGASTFIAVTSTVPYESVAVAASGSYLSASVGTVLGISLSSTIQRSVLRRSLTERLTGSDRAEVCILLSSCGVELT